MAHLAEAAFIDEVNDELHLVAAFKIGDFGLIAGSDQRFETGLDQFRHTAAQDGLFAEEVGFGFRAEGRFDDTGFARAVGGGVRKRHVVGGAGDVLVDGNELRNALACNIGGAHRVARGLRSNHDDVKVGARLNLTVVHVKAVGKRERRTLLDVGEHLVAVDLSDVFVRNEHHDDVGRAHRIFNGCDLKTGCGSLLPACAVLTDADRDVNTGIVQIEGMRMALTAVADDRHFLSLDEREISVLIVVNLHFFTSLFSVGSHGA